MNCPFCGVDTQVPHDTQQACIQALQAEIERVRRLLDRSRPLQTGPAMPHHDESVLPDALEGNTPDHDD